MSKSSSPKKKKGDIQWHLMQNCCLCKFAHNTVIILNPITLTIFCKSKLKQRFYRAIELRLRAINIVQIRGLLVFMAQWLINTYFNVP